VVIHYFDRRVEDGRFLHYVVSPKIDKDGRIDMWPRGFFDQWEQSLDALMD
jgi:hypothetical protein